MDKSGRRHEHVRRDAKALKEGRWNAYNGTEEPLTPIPTPETKPPSLASVYALTKYDQERMSLIVGQAYDIPTVALRFFNVFGPRQALSNPYTGVLAIFASRVLNNHPPLIYEDGLQQRDFVSVYDVAQACRLALETPEAAGEVFNVASGRRYTIRQVADLITRALGRPDLEPVITGKYRVGDIRHCFADISRTREVLGYEPRVILEDHMDELAAWLQDQEARDRAAEAQEELASRNLAL
jgi:dTDP-L-rhamnose 4-epimerase